MKLALEGELAEKKLSPEFLQWLDIQIDDCGSQVAFAREIGAQKTTIYQWKKNKVGEIRPEFLEELMRYMALLPGDRRIVAASISEVRDFVESGIMPGSDPNRLENLTEKLGYKPRPLTTWRAALVFNVLDQGFNGRTANGDGEITGTP